MFKGTTRKTFLRIGAGVVVVVVLFAINLLIGADIERRLVLLRETQKELSFRRNALESLVLLKNESRAAGFYANNLNAILPTQDRVVSVQKDLRDLADQNDLNFTFLFGVASDATQEAPGSIGFEFTARGAFSDFVDFLKLVENDTYFIGNETVELNFGERLSAVVRGKVFSQ